LGVWTLLSLVSVFVVRKGVYPSASPTGLASGLMQPDRTLEHQKQGDRNMDSATTSSSTAESLRKAIENLINVKLHDALAKPGGLDRLIAHRSMGVASFAVRQAERQLEDVLSDILPSDSYSTHA
jgi:hypothetical protein